MCPALSRCTAPCPRPPPPDRNRSRRTRPSHLHAFAPHLHRSAADPPSAQPRSPLPPRALRLPSRPTTTAPQQAAATLAPPCGERDSLIWGGRDLQSDPAPNNQALCPFWGRRKRLGEGRPGTPPIFVFLGLGGVMIDDLHLNSPYAVLKKKKKFAGKKKQERGLSGSQRFFFKVSVVLPDSGHARPRSSCPSCSLPRVEGKRGLGGNTCEEGVGEVGQPARACGE